MKNPLFTPVNWYHVLGCLFGTLWGIFLGGCGTDCPWWVYVVGGSVTYFASKWLASILEEAGYELKK